MPDLVVGARQRTALPLGIHRYDSVTVKRGGVLSVAAWDGREGGGALRLEVAGDIIVEEGGTIDVSGLGYRGGREEGDIMDGMSSQGEAAGGRGGQSTESNRGGGGGGICSSDYGSAGGGGGGYGRPGEQSEPNRHQNGNNPGGKGGHAHGSPDLAGGPSLGSGGGAGKSYNHPNGAPLQGGDGGGIVHLVANRIVISQNSSLLADGADGTAGRVNYSSGGGGGSGGTIHLVADDVSIRGQVSAVGGAGGAAGPDNNNNGICSTGGRGGVGRIRIDVHALDDRGGQIEPRPHRQARPSPPELVALRGAARRCAGAGGAARTGVRAAP